MANLESAPTAVSADRIAWENPLARVRWSAVWAGLVAATGLQIVLAVLGAAVGSSILGVGRAGGVGLGEGIWLLIIVIVTMFVGGMTAARLAGVRSGFESLVHGTLVWALSAMLAVWLIGSAASHVLGGTLSVAGNLTGSAVTAAGEVAGSVAGQAAGAVASSPNTAQSGLQSAADQAKQVAAQHGVTADSARALAGNAADRVREAAGSVAGQVHGVATGTAWLAFAALVLSFFAAWLGARRAMPPRAEQLSGT